MAVLCSNHHHSDDKAMDIDVPAEATKEGIKIVEDFLRSWVTPTDGEDVVMDLEEISPELQLAQLKAHVDQYLPQIERNPWLQSLLTTL